jgi:2-polyprenyl-6-methoxyphenol hydroxylase-like FAD-dependent oxidoreductase
MRVAEVSRLASTHQTTCCIVGGGPAGVMLGYLLARKGVRVTVLEKHKDFFRDFRGDTVHPSTMELMYELELLEKFLHMPHQKLRSISGVVGGFRFKVADFSRVPTHCKFVALSMLKRATDIRKKKNPDRISQCEFEPVSYS